MAAVAAAQTPPPLSFRGQIEPRSATSGRAWKVRAAYEETGIGWRRESTVAEGPIDEQAAFRLLIPHLPHGTESTGRLLFYLLDEKSTVIGGLLPNETDEGYRTSFGYGVRVPLLPVSTNSVEPVMTFNAAYTSDRHPEAVLSIRPRHAPFRLGQSMFLDLTLKNNSDRVLTMITQSPAWDYEWEIRDAAGRSLMLSSAVKRPDIITSITPIHLRPGQERKDSVLFDKLFDLHLPGVYTIRARRTLSSQQVVISPACTVQVLP